MMEGEGSGSRTIAFVLYPGLTPLDLIGPLQVFAALSRFGIPDRAVVVAERAELMESDLPLRLQASHTFEEVPSPDVVVVPGGGEGTLRAAADDRILDYVRRASETAEFVTSVCTGALILASAGLLEGRRATTHWAYNQLLDRLGARYVPERWVEDGKFITAAGVSAGIDMALYLVAKLRDESTARLAQLAVEYDPQPPFGPIDWSSVDRNAFTSFAEGLVREGLADRPDLLRRLTSGSGVGREAGS